MARERTTLKSPDLPAQPCSSTYRVSQNYPNMQFFAIFATALKPLMLWFPKFFRITHQESKLNVTLSPRQHIIPFRH